MAPSVSRITPLAEARRGSTERDEAGGSIGGYVEPRAQDVPPRADRIGRGLQEFVASEKVSALYPPIFDGIGAVHGVLAYVRSEHFSDGAIGGLRRIRGADDVSIVLHGVFTLESDDDDLAASHERAELVEEGPFAVNRIEALGRGP